jgi:hypothetical protein
MNVDLWLRAERTAYIVADYINKEQRDTSTIGILWTASNKADP